MRDLNPRNRQKLRTFIFDLSRNISAQTLLNQYIDGGPQRQQDGSLDAERSWAGSGN
jgi:hypothetical protein